MIQSSKPELISGRVSGTKFQKPTHVDLFAGPGGLATGFLAAGFRTVAAVEFVESCVDTYRANHPNVPILHLDVRKVSGDHFQKLGIDHADVVSAGIPCETFSTAGSSSRSFYDSRQILYRDVIRIAKLLSSRVILLENVPALLTKRIRRDSKTLVIEKIRRDLTRSGYPHITTAVLDASDFGVPQRRERLFIIASTSPLEIDFVRTTGKKVSVREALADLPKLEANSTPPADGLPYIGRPSRYAKLMRTNKSWGVNNHVPPRPTFHQSPKHRPATLTRFSLIKPGEGLKDLFEKLDTDTIKRFQKSRVLPNAWYIQRNRRLIEHSQAPTVTSHCLDEFIHYSHDRALSVREVARLQSFPDWYQFPGGPFICPHNAFEQDKYEQIGDAVPPLLALAVADAIMRAAFPNKSRGTRVA